MMVIYSRKADKRTCQMMSSSAFSTSETLRTDSAIAQGGTTDYNLLQRCYIGWNIAGGTTSNSLQKEYEWAVYLSAMVRVHTTISG
jgi:hypothetical protein